jgi:hypothetical protein
MGCATSIRDYLVMRRTTGILTIAALAAAGTLASQRYTSHAQTAQANAQTEAGVIRVEWNDPELKRFKAAPRLESASRGGSEKLAGLRLPVLAFTETPELVRNALGADAKPVKPRTVVTDAATPVWYHIVDTYGDISITVDADLRINHVNDSEQQIKRRPLTLDGLKNGGKTKISIFDGAKEEGLEGVMVEYTIHKFPDIPYTVTIECRGATKAQCRDVATITRDQALLKVISSSR